MPNKIPNSEKIDALEKLHKQASSLKSMFNDNLVFLADIELFLIALDIEIIKYKKGEYNA